MRRITLTQKKWTITNPTEWQRGSFQDLPDFSEPEELLRALEGVTDIEDVIRTYGRFGKSYQGFRIEESEDPVRQQERVKQLEEDRKLKE
jgi:hypothetical protein